MGESNQVMNKESVLKSAFGSIVRHYNSFMILNLRDGKLQKIVEDGRKLEVKDADYDIEDILPQLDDVYPDDRKRVSSLLKRDYIQQAYEKGETELRVVYRKCNDQDGVYEWYELKVLVPSDMDEPAIITVKNISRDMNNNPGIDAVNNIINVASLEKNDLLLKISQELETPLNHIIGVTKMMQAKDTKTIERSYEKEIADSADYIKKAMENVLGMSMKINHGKTLNYSRVRLGNMFKWLESVFGEMAGRKNIKLQFTTSSPEDRELMIDREKCMLVYYNLLMNAIDYTPHGGSIKVHTKEVYEREGIVFIKSVIKDNGIGMSREYQQKLFSVYGQLSGKEVMESGLGMTIARNYLHLMDGTMCANSKHSRGTTLSIVYTAKLPEYKGKRPMKPPVLRSMDISSRKFLVIEDNDINRGIIKQMLIRAGAEVVEACNGKEAIEIFNRSGEGEINLILSDIMMPQCNGFELSMQIRQLDREDAKTVPIVAVTANTFENDISGIFASGMDAFVPKPIKRSVLYGVIDEMING